MQSGHILTFHVYFTWLKDCLSTTINTIFSWTEAEKQQFLVAVVSLGNIKHLFVKYNKRETLLCVVLAASFLKAACKVKRTTTPM